MLLSDTGLAGKPVSLTDQFVGLVLHALQQSDSRGGGDARPLEVENFPLLPLDLHAHAGDLGLEVVEFHGQIPEDGQ